MCCGVITKNNDDTSANVQAPEALHAWWKWNRHVYLTIHVRFMMVRHNIFMKEIYIRMLALIIEDDWLNESWGLTVSVQSIHR